jgi:hypothetical protein
MGVVVQVQVAKAGLVLSTKDKKTAVKLRAPAEEGTGEEAPQDSAGGLADGQVLGEVQTFYRLTDGECKLLDV